jgi:hypothetical protein
VQQFADSSKLNTFWQSLKREQKRKREREKRKVWGTCLYCVEEDAKVKGKLKANTDEDKEKVRKARNK